jgi:tetratricopeptide (TPR) repeat protein
MRQALAGNDNSIGNHEHLGEAYFRLSNFDLAIPEFEKVLELNAKSGSKPAAYIYQFLIRSYYKIGQNKKAKKLVKNAIRDYPDRHGIISQIIILYLLEGNTREADEYIEKFRSIRKKESVSEASIMSSLGFAYSEAGMHEKAEQFYRDALSIEPENPGRLFNLGWFLINKDRNINQGIELLDKVSNLYSEAFLNYQFLDHYGWGLFKQDKYQEAFELLQKSWDLRMEKAVYDHESFLHLEAAKKAVTGMK